MLTEIKDIQNELVNFYKKLLGTCAQSLLYFNLTVFRAGPTLIMSTIAELIQPVTIAEIDRAFFDIVVSKAPRKDGFNAVLFL